jgi:DNA-binding transcriptional MerR regulator
MLRTMFQITEFARLAGVSPKVMRDYDRLGLFRPAWVDPMTGYRRYSPAQLPELRRIIALRDLGVGLATIRRLALGGADLRSVLEDRRAELEAARRDVDRRLAAVGISIDAESDRARSNGQPIDVVVRHVPAELVATLDIAELGGDEAKAFYVLESQVRDLGIRAPRPPGTLLDEDRVEVFVPVRRPGRNLATRRLPAIRAATALHRGSYAGFEATEAALDRWLAAAGLAPAGPRRVLYLQFGAEAELRLPAAYLVERPSELVTEVQVPI